MLPERAYLRRDRAESFGAIAASYDRYRPGYPTELIDDLVAGRPRTALDIGCGTGKAGRLLADRGVTVLGGEIDPLMADVARTHGLDVEVAGFEDWDPARRTFDLVVSGQAWHWVDPALAAPKVAALLAATGVFTAFWNWDEPDERSQAAIEAVYAAVGPELAAAVAPGADRRDNRPYLRDLEATGAFGSLQVRDYHWTRRHEIEEWIALLSTHSQHVLLGPERFAELAAGLRAALTAPVEVTGGTYAIIGREPRR